MINQCMDSKKWTLSNLPNGLERIAQIGILGIGAITTILAVFNHYSNSQSLLNRILVNNSLYVNSFLHYLLIFIVLVLGRVKRIELDKSFDYYQSSITKSSRLKKALEAINNEFLPNWSRLWISWGALYTVFLFFAFTSIHSSTESNLQVAISTYTLNEIKYYMNVIMSFANNYGSIFILLMYFSMQSEKNDYQFIKYILYFLPIIIMIIELCYPYDPTDQTVFNLYSAFSGVFMAISLGLFIGKLDSKYLNAYQWQLSLLFLYAAIQPFYSVYGSNIDSTSASFIKAVVSYSAFLLKCIFYLFIYEIFTNKKIVFFYYKALKTETD